MYPWMPWAHADYSPDESRAWINKAPQDWKRDTAYEFGIFDAGDGNFIGGCGLNRVDRPNRNANLGYWVRSGRAGRGVAPVAALLLAGWGFRTLGLRRLEIVVATGNLRSQRVAEKAGAQREGVLRNRLSLYGKCHDAALYSLVPGDLAGRGEPG
jgi:RimJ/RimL family protein N-acetyltransferase